MSCSLISVIGLLSIYSVPVICQNFQLFVGDFNGIIYTLDEHGEVVDMFNASDSANGLAIDTGQNITDDNFNIVYSVKTINDTGVIYKKKSGATGEDNEEIFDLSEYGAYVGRLAIDQTSGNIYFTAVVPAWIKTKSFISVLSPFADHLPIVAGLDSPADIVLHPEIGIMFWSDRGTSPHISSANMDGTEREPIISTHIVSPNGLAIDFNADALYWTDGQLHTIEKCDFSGGMREKILELQGKQLMDIMIDGDILYYSNWNDRNIMKTDINNPDKETLFAVIPHAYKLSQIVVFSSDFLKKPKNTACSERQGLGDCSNICLPTSDGYSCGCNYEFGLKENGKTCVNAELCPEEVINGRLSSLCNRHRLEVCEFSCNNGYETIFSEISCNGSHWDEANPCRDIDECAFNNGGCQNECHNLPGGFTCCDWPYVVDLLDRSKCRVPLFPYGNEVGDSQLPRQDDACGSSLRSPIDIPIYGQMHNNIIVCTNGLVTFDTPYLRWWPPGDIRSIGDRTILAPYFGDVDIRGSQGNVFFQSYHTYSDQEESLVIRLARVYIRDSMQNDFSPKFVFVVTWYQVPNYPYYWNSWCWWWWSWYCYSSWNPHVATFQMVLITDGFDSYVMYIYDQNNMNWIQQYSFWTPPILTGFIVRGGLYYKVHPFSFTNLELDMDRYTETNGLKGLLIYHLKQPGISLPVQNYGAMCLNWYYQMRAEQTNPSLFKTCPCDTRTLRWDPWFFGISMSTYDTVCYDSWAWWINYPNTIRCCYGKATGVWISNDPRAGGFLYYHPVSHPTFHHLYDVNTRRYCCDLSNNCDKFRQLRPIGTCYTRSFWRRAWFFGDPHITTQDSKTYTFNGLGEYILLEIRTENVTFSLQGRTERAITAEGTTTDATVFSAFAAKDNTGATVQVEMSANKTGLIVYGNGIDMTDLIQNESLSVLFLDSKIKISRENKSLNAFFMKTGIQLVISLGKEMLSQEVTVPKEYMGLTRGLLGNNDGNPDNDLVFQNGSVVGENETEREIFHFGQSWMTTREQSIFEYPTGRSHADFNFPNFVPKFLDEADKEVVSNATQICGKENLECIFDLVFTGSEEIAEETKQANIQHTEAVMINENDAPVLNGTKRINMTYGEMFEILITGTDESSLNFTITNNSAVELTNTSDNSATILLHASEMLTDQISLFATDIMGKTSALFVFDIVLCTGCNQHGLCNFSQYRTQTNSTDSIKYAVCVCDGYEDPFWSGDDCEEDYNGCLYQTCDTEQDCIDFNATYHRQTGKAFKCSDCPQGFDLNDTKCQDIDECEVDTIECEQVCVNTEGSYECVCDLGYRRKTDDLHACEDINECEEASHNCEQICVNTNGSFRCSCYTGFELNADNFSCLMVTDICEDFFINCTTTAGCHNESGMAECFCKSGFELTDNGTNCKDTDECQRNVCSQLCINTYGSFKCGCLIGYEIQPDGTSCEACNNTRWGVDCKNTCLCGPGAVSCNSVRGCMCDSGWTGPTCTTDIDECLDPSVCGDVNKICLNTLGSYDCFCRDGFQIGNDKFCEDINECENLTLNTCQHNCNNVVGNFTCGCNPGFVTSSSDPFTCEDIDECSTGIAACVHFCKNVPGRYNCYCHFGYVLNDDRRTCRQIEDLCAFRKSLNCSHICLVKNEESKCECPRGYHLAPDMQTCVDINECANPELNLCSEHNTCYNFDGGYDCSCPVGTRLENDGRSCVVCDEFHYGLNCEKTCDCLIGSDYCDSVLGCICKPGWAGKQCGEDKNECDGVIDPCSGLHVGCINTAGSYKCVCNNGFTFVNGTCTDNEECESLRLNNCDQVCQNTVGSYLCQCSDGFIMFDGNCEDINECMVPNDCQQLCSNTIGGYRCHCENGFRLDMADGRSCIADTECSEQNKTECWENNADCVFRNDKEECVCRKGYEEVNGSCSDIKECEENPHPCAHDCQEKDGSYACSCYTGFKLAPDKITCRACENWTWGDECNRTCACFSENTANYSTYNGSCTCLPGWTGTSCDEDINECQNNIFSCPENSACTNTNGSYICKCHRGFIKTSSGTCIECEFGKWGEDCLKQCECSMAQTSICNITDGSCNCNDGWTGEKCDKDIDECLTVANVCNRSTEICINTMGSFVCNCKDGFKRNAKKKCEVCNVEIFGSICSSDCNCVAENTRFQTTECDPVSGFCPCFPEWTGLRCNIDIDECKTGAHDCGSLLCRNTLGGFECVCEEGFHPGTDGNCIEDDVDNKGWITGLAVGLPLGIFVLIGVIVAAVCVKGSKISRHSLQCTETQTEQNRAFYTAYNVSGPRETNDFVG